MGPNPESSDVDSGRWAPSVEMSRTLLSSRLRARLLVCEGLVSMSSSKPVIFFSSENTKNAVEIHTCGAFRHCGGCSSGRKVHGICNESNTCDMSQP
jgi:hypothetical protein